MVCNAAQDGQAGHQHGVVVVAEPAVLAERDKGADPAQVQQAGADTGLAAEPGQVRVSGGGAGRGQVGSS